MTDKADLLARVREVLEAAATHYGVPELRHTTVLFDLRGLASAKAYMTQNKLRFNLQALQLDPEHVMGQTVPHEVAHLVAYALHRDSGHGPAWRRIARQMGCAGERCHSIRLTPARRTVRHLYVTPDGHRFVVGSQRHAKLQKGARYVGLVAGRRVLFSREDYKRPEESR